MKTTLLHKLGITLAGVLAFLAITLLAPVAAQAQYSFTNIADSTGPFFQFDEPSINATGVVSFRASLDSGARASSVATVAP